MVYLQKNCKYSNVFEMNQIFFHLLKTTCFRIYRTEESISGVYKSIYFLIKNEIQICIIMKKYGLGWNTVEVSLEMCMETSPNLSNQIVFPEPCKIHFIALIHFLVVFTI